MSAGVSEEILLKDESLFRVGGNLNLRRRQHRMMNYEKIFLVGADGCEFYTHYFKPHHGHFVFKTRLFFDVTYTSMVLVITLLYLNNKASRFAPVRGKKTQEGNVSLHLP